MVWDDTMQEPTAADHGDVLYNIGVNQTYNCSCFRLHFHELPTSFVNTITSTNFTFTFMLQQNRGIITNCCVSPVKFFACRKVTNDRQIHGGKARHPSGRGENYQMSSSSCGSLSFQIEIVTFHIYLFLGLHFHSRLKLLKLDHIYISFSG